MTPDPRRYAWIVLGAACAIISVSIGTLMALGVFLKPIEDAMGWSRSAIGAIGLTNWIVMGLGSFVSGYLSDRVGTRAVVLAGGGLLGLGLVLSSQATTLWQFYLTFGVIVAGGVSAFYVPLTATAIKWFDGSRGLAAAIVSAGIGVGVLVLSPLSRWLINALDWRLALLILGDLAWLVVIPMALLVRNSPAELAGAAAVAPEPTAVVEVEPSRGAAARAAFGAWPFWAIALTHFLCCAAHSGPIFHMVTNAMDLGVERMAAATLLGVSGLTSIAGRIGAGLLADRIGAKPALLGALGLQAASVLTYLVARDLGALYGLSVVFGLAYGGAMPLYPLITREYFGERAMGTAYGAVFFISSLGMGLGSWAGGAIHDALGTYAWLFIGSFGVGAMAIVLGATLRPPRLVPVGAPA